MGCIHRAFLYVTRKKGKSILLFVLLLVIATFVLTGLSTSKAARETQNSLRRKLGGTFTLAPNYTEENPYFKMEAFEDGSFLVYTEKPVTKAEIDTVMETEGVVDYSASTQILAASDLAILPGTIPIEDEFRKLVTTQVVAATQQDSFFQSGRFALSEGRHITETDKNVAVISKALAEKNHLKIGDFITLQNEGSSKAELIGLYDILKPDPPFVNVTSYDKLENQIFIDLGTFQELIPDRAVGYDSVVFHVADPAQLAAIVSQVRSIPSFDWRLYTIDAENQTFQDAAEPLMKLQALVNVILLIIIAVSVIVLSLLLTMRVRNRVHETGMLLSIGIKKTVIIGQYLAEILMIAVIAFGLSYFTGNVIAARLANGLLLHQMQTEEAQSGDPAAEAQLKEGHDGIELSVKDANTQTASSDGGSAEDGRSMEAAAAEAPAGAGEIHIAIGFGDMLRLYLIGFGIIILSVLVCSASVMRLKPREILSRMS